MLYNPVMLIKFIFTKHRSIIAMACLSFLMNTIAFGQNPFDILITEIMADPTPTHGLPEIEYIEIYNTTNQEISLNGLILEYQTSTVDFPNENISPGEYLIICRSNNVTILEPYGRVVGLSKFSLLNAGALLRLVNKEGGLIHQVNYSSEWYTVGKDQGYALELKDLNSACKDFGNWASSEADAGGTPGLENSIRSMVSDLEGPNLLSTNEIDSLTVELTFNEGINTSELSNISLATSLNITEVKFSESLNNTLIIKFLEPLPRNRVVSVEIDGIQDCLGNLADVQSFTVGSLPEAVKGQLVLTEVLFNPFSGGADFVEIYNTTSEEINIKGLKLARRNSLGEIDDVKEIAEYNLALQPKQVFCFTESLHAQIDNYPKAKESNIIVTKDIPSYPNEMGEVILLGKSGLVLDSVIYNVSMHDASIDNPDGVSLERFGLQDIEISKWVSSSSFDNYASPGYLATLDNINDGIEMLITPKVFTPDSDGINDEVAIKITVSKPGNLSAAIYDINGKEVKILSNNAYINSVAEYYWDGTQGSKEIGNVGYYIVVIQHVTENEHLQIKDTIVLGEK